MRKPLVSNAFGTHSEWALFAEPTWRQYAALHGYDVQVFREPPEHARDFHNRKLVKLATLKAALDEADLVLWLDADAMVVNFDTDIAGSLYADDFQGLVLEQFRNRFNPNTGVWLLRNDPETHRFLAALETTKVPEGYVWADQALVMAALGWQLAPMPHGVKPVHGSPFLARTGWLSPEWNTIEPSNRFPTRIRHYAGGQGTGPTRRQQMAEQLGELVRASTVARELCSEEALLAIERRVRR